MRKMLIALLLSLSLAGCGSLGTTENTVLISETIVTVSEQLDFANKEGLIEDAEELRLQKKLLAAHDLLAGTSGSLAALPECLPSQSRFECVDAILASIQTRLTDIGVE